MLLGPVAKVVFWRHALLKYRDRLCDFSVAQTGAADRVRLHARRVFLVLPYLVQFRGLDLALFGLERRALQVDGPWQAIPSRCVRRLDGLRLPSVPTLAAARLADGAHLVVTTLVVCCVRSI